MDAISFAINKVKQEIPPDVLNIAFTPRAREMRYTRTHGNIDVVIRDRIIEGIVRPDIDAIGATEVDIPLEETWRSSIDRFRTVWKVPKSATQNRIITHPIAMSYGTNSTLGGAANGGVQAIANNNIRCGNSNLKDAALSMSAAFSPIPQVSSANLSMLSENVVLLEDFVPISRTLWLRCLVTNDSQFSNIQTSRYDLYSKLVVQAAKKHIYNNLRIEINRGYLEGGQELTAIRDIVESYSDASQLYDQLLNERWRKSSVVNDPHRKRRSIARITGGLF